MPMQGHSPSIRSAHAPSAQSRPALDAARDDPGWLRFLLVLFMITLFVPSSVALQIGSLSVTPALACGIIFFPILLSGGRIKFAWPDAVVVTFFVMTFYSMLLSAPMGEAIESFGRRVLLGIVPYLIGRYIGSRPIVFDRFMRRILTVMAVLAVFLLLESFFRFNIHSFIWAEPYSPHHERRLGLTRAYGWTSHSIMLGVSYAVFIPVMMIAVKERMNRLGSYRWIKLGLLMLGTFCSLSTGAWMPAVLAMGLVVWDYLKWMTPKQRWLLASVGGTSMYFILEVASGRSLLMILMMELHLSSPLAWYYRWMLYERVYSVMPGFEWFGHGIQTPAAFQNTVQWSIDNNYLVILMQYGRVGLTLWFAVMLSVIVYGWRSVWNAPDTPYRRIARAVMFAVVTVGLTQLSVALFSTAAILNWMFMGLAIGMAQGLARKTPQKTRPKRRARTNPERADRPAVQGARVSIPR